MGDSTSAGFGAGTTGPMNDARACSWPTRLAALFPGALDLSAQSESWFGDASTAFLGVPLSAYDPRIAVGEGWTSKTLITSVGGNLLSACVGEPLSFTPSTPVDHFDIFFAAYPSNGNFDVLVDGSREAVVHTGGGAAFATVGVACELGLRTLDISPKTSAAVYVAGVSGYNSTIPAADICNMGACGATTGFWTDTANPWSPLNALGIFAPDLTIVDLGINDLILEHGAARTTVEGFSRNLQRIISVAHASGDVLLLGCGPCRPSGTNPIVPSEQVQADYRAAARSVADQQGCLWLDMNARWGGWDSAEAMGYLYDEVHLTALGHAEKARAVAELLASA